MIGSATKFAVLAASNAAMMNALTMKSNNRNEAQGKGVQTVGQCKFAHKRIVLPLQTMVRYDNCPKGEYCSWEHHNICKEKKPLGAHCGHKLKMNKVFSFTRGLVHAFTGNKAGRGYAPDWGYECLSNHCNIWNNKCEEEAVPKSFADWVHNAEKKQIQSKE